MVIAKVKGGYVILHVTLKSKIGQKIHATLTPKSLSQVHRIHTAIIMSKKRKGEKLSLPGYEKILINKGWIKKKYWERKRR